MTNSVTKVYTLVEPGPDDRCIARVYDTERDYDICGEHATRLVNLETTTVTGSRVHSRMGFCALHFPRRYSRWFLGIL